MSNTAYQTTSVRYNDIRHLLLHEMPEKAQNGELTVDDLHEAVRMICEDLTTNPSVGLVYLLGNPTTFERIVPASQRAEFFRSHLDNPGIHHVIAHWKIMHSIPEDDRAQLALDITSRQPMPDCTWVALVADVASDAAAFACIQAQLDTSRFTLEQSRPFAEDFLQHGAGKVAETTPYIVLLTEPAFVLLDNHPMWCVVPKEEFRTIVQQCLERAPELLFMEGTFKEPRLTTKLTAFRPQQDVRRNPHTNPDASRMLEPEVVDELTLSALPQLTSLHDLSVDALMFLPFEAQRSLAERGLPGSVAFLVRATLWYDEQDDEATAKGRLVLFKDNFVRLEGTPGPELLAAYRKVVSHIYIYPSEPEQSLAAAQINERLVRLLSRHGYLIGRVARVNTPKHGEQTVLHSVLAGKSRGDRRIMANGRKFTIIQNERQLEHFPTGQLAFVDLNTDNLAAWRVNEGNRFVFGIFQQLWLT